MSELEQASELASLEQVIERGLETFIEVGQALMRIRDERLYREAGYSSFDAYCRERWGHRRAWADRHITAIRKIAELDPTGSTPENEWQARQLTSSSSDEWSPVDRDAAEFAALFQKLRESHWHLAELAHEVVATYGEGQLPHYANEIGLELEAVEVYRDAWAIFGPDGSPGGAFDRYIERGLYGFLDAPEDAEKRSTPGGL